MEEQTKKDEPMSDKEFEKAAENWFKSKFAKWDENGCGCGKHKRGKTIYKTGAGAGVYCIGWIGALVYYIGSSASFWDGVLGILKSFVWPAFLVHGLLTSLGI